jgi:hypothetical protein
MLKVQNQTSTKLKDQVTKISWEADIQFEQSGMRTHYGV